jgi:hypothetical protein
MKNKMKKKLPVEWALNTLAESIRQVHVELSAQALSRMRYEYNHKYLLRRELSSAQ